MVLQSVPSFLIDALTAVVGVLALARSGKAPSGTGLIRTSGTLPVMAALIVLGWRADTTVLLYDTLLLLPSADTASAAGPMPPLGPLDNRVPRTLRPTRSSRPCRRGRQARRGHRRPSLLNDGRPQLRLPHNRAPVLIRPVSLPTTASLRGHFPAPP